MRVPDPGVLSIGVVHSDTFEGNALDINEKVWDLAGLDWRTVKNRTSSVIGATRWVVSGYLPDDGAYVFVVEVGA
jgi:hypothetical protein